MNFLIEIANSTGDQWVAWAAAGLLDGAVLLVLVTLVWAAIHRRVAPQVGYCLFLLVPLKLLLPLSVSVPREIAQWTPWAIVSASFDTTDTDSSHENNFLARSQLSRSETYRSEPSASSSKSSANTPAAAADSNKFNSLASGDYRPGIVSATGQIPRNAMQSTRLSVSAAVMLVWLVLVVLLLGQLLRAQLRFRKRLQGLPSFDESRLTVNLRELCRRAGVTQAIRVLESDDIAAPAVWGIARPAIILPRGITSSLTAQQLRWVLLHELAHIRRRDLCVVVLQRCAAVVNFFNPAVWIANRIAHRLREYACDDLAVVLSEGSAVDSGEAFLQILQHAQRRHRRLDGALGVFGLDSRASCRLRINRLLDTERPIHTKIGAGAVCALMILAVISLPHMRAASDDNQAESPTATQAEKTTAQEKADSTNATVNDTHAFELLVVGPDKKPVPNVNVEIRMKPVPTAEQVQRGKFVRKGSYWALLTADADGRLVVALPEVPGSFNVDITTPGYGPYWAGWSSQQNIQLIPARFTAELEAGWSVGGVVVDSEGKPVEGVHIHPSVNFKKRQGDLEQLGIGVVLKTDAEGKWKFDSVPASKGEVFAEISHPAFMPNRLALTRSQFGLDPGRQPATKIVLDRGLTVTGKVTDEDGHPISGAWVRTKFHNDIREAKTRDDGVYRLVGCEARTAQIVVSAKGRATDMLELRVDPELGSVDFQLKPGGKVRIRVLDEKDNPVPKARIFFQKWRGPFSYFEFDHVSQYADEKGIWEWAEAPLDEFKADICHPDGMQLGRQSLIARDEEYVFRVPQALVISGRVIDAKTKERIQEFQVTPGVRFNESQMSWTPSQQFVAKEGKYQIRHTHDSFAHLIRIEANGYQSAVSRDIKSNEGNVTIDFELKKGINVAATVLTPDGAPAGGAKIALGVAGSQISIKNGDFESGQTYASRQETDTSGKFQFPPQNGPFQLVILHPTGYAHIINTSPESTPKMIRLEAWARVEGTFRVGKDLGANVPLKINTAGIRSYGQDVASIFNYYHGTTGKDGRFVFERVFAGAAHIGRDIMLTVEDGAADVTSSCLISVNLESAKTTQLDLGGTGIAAVGKLQPPEGFAGKVNWNFALVTVEPYLPTPPQPKGPQIPAEIDKDPAKKAAWLLKWQETPEGKGWTAWTTAIDAINRLRDRSPYLSASVNRDGTFRIDDMPAGDYSLSVRFSRDAPGFLHDHRIVVPPTDSNQSVEPLQLGLLILQK